MPSTAKRALRRRRICVGCQKRVTFYIFENGVHLPLCGCAGFIQGTTPYEHLNFRELEEADPYAAVQYLFYGPTEEEIRQMNAEHRLLRTLRSIATTKEEDEDLPAF